MFTKQILHVLIEISSHKRIEESMENSNKVEHV